MTRSPRSHVTQARNPAFGIAVLLVCTVVSGASRHACGGFKFNHDAFEERIQKQLLKNIRSISPLEMGTGHGVVAPRHAEPWRRSSSSSWVTCGWGSPSNFNFEPRPTKLPDDPTLILAAGYLRCQRVEISLLDPRVPVTAYPPGHFGDYVYENTLIADRLEFSDERSLRQIFQLVTRSADAVNDTWAFWLDAPQTDPTVSDFRSETRFTPELLVEFVGETDVRVEIDFTQQKILIQSGARWEIYTLDQGSGAALINIAIVEQTKRR